MLIDRHQPLLLGHVWSWLSLHIRLLRRCWLPSLGDTLVLWHCRSFSLGTMLVDHFHHTRMLGHGKIWFSLRDMLDRCNCLLLCFLQVV